jgi:large subunit ribosomal protein L21
MFAIVEVASKQHRVAVGDILDVPRLTSKKGISFDKVLMAGSGKEITVGTPYIKGAKVVCDIISDIKGEKKIAYKFYRRKGYHRKVGHRDLLTRVKIKDIVLEKSKE